MFRSSFLGIVVTVTLAGLVSVQVRGQDPSATGKPPVVGLQVAPATIAQTPADDKTLVDKASFLFGYNLMTQIKGQDQEMDAKQVIEGMNDAARGVDRLGYATGFQIMTTLKDQSEDLVQIEKLIEGMNAASTGAEMGMSQADAGVMMDAFRRLVEAKKIANVKLLADKNLADGIAYMAENAKNPNVKTLDGGIQYEILVDGTGPQPTPADRVRLHYEGSFIDGTVFDSSINPPPGRAKSPVELGVAQFVPGFSKSLQGMKVGSKWKVAIPGPLAYGLNSRGKIGPNQLLIFEISLLEILKPGVENAPTGAEDKSPPTNKN